MKNFDNNLAGVIIKASVVFTKKKAGSLHYNISDLDHRTVRQFLDQIEGCLGKPSTFFLMIKSNKKNAAQLTKQYFIKYLYYEHEGYLSKQKTIRKNDYRKTREIMLQILNNQETTYQQIKQNKKKQNIMIQIGKDSQQEGQQVVLSSMNEQISEAQNQNPYSEQPRDFSQINARQPLASSMFDKPVSSHKNKEQCTIHAKKFKQYYCSKCLITVCPDCAIFGQHKLHQIQKIPDAAKILKEKIKQNAQKAVQEIEQDGKLLKIIEQKLGSNEHRFKQVIDDYFLKDNQQIKIKHQAVKKKRDTTDQILNLQFQENDQKIIKQARNINQVLDNLDKLKEKSLKKNYQIGRFGNTVDGIEKYCTFNRRKETYWQFSSRKHKRIKR